MNREPLEIRFIIDAPHTEYQSDFNTLILRIEKLKPIKEYEMFSFNDIIKTLCENREKINEIISKISE